MRVVTLIAYVASGALVACATQATSGWGNGSGKDGGSGGDDAGEGDDAATGDDAGDDGGAQQEAAPPPCKYPAGPYGKTQGSVLSPTLQWQGYDANSSSVSTVKATDLYDCDGTRGINAIIIDESALWCGACQQEAQQIKQSMNGTWGTDGVKPVTLIVQNMSQQPASVNDALTWKNEFALTSAVLADPGFSFAHSGTIGLSMNILVDPRTMKIVSVVEGYGGEDPQVDALAQKNKH